MTTTSSTSNSKLGRTKLDRAIYASVAAMTILVLSQQLQPVPSFAAATSTVAAQQA